MSYFCYKDILINTVSEVFEDLKFKISEGSLSFSSHFLFFVFHWFWLTKLQKCLFAFLKSLACLTLQMETIIKKSTQPKLPKTENELTNICNGTYYFRKETLLSTVHNYTENSFRLFTWREKMPHLFWTNHTKNCHCVKTRFSL